MTKIKGDEQMKYGDHQIKYFKIIAYFKWMDNLSVLITGSNAENIGLFHMALEEKKVP